VADALAVPMEHERADRAGRLELLVNRQLCGQDLLEVDCERERPAFVVLRRVRVQSDAASVPIDVPPFERQHFGGGPPTRGECEPDDVRQLARPLLRIRGRLSGFQRRTDAIDLVAIEEAAPRVAFA